MNQNNSFTAQVAIRGDGLAHVQVEANFGTFASSYSRHYGGAFDIVRKDVIEAVAERSVSIKSMAGTSRRYAPATLLIRPDGKMELTLTGGYNGGSTKPATKLLAAKAFAPKYGKVGGCGGGGSAFTFTISDSDIRP